MKTRTIIRKELISHNTAHGSNIGPAEKCRRGLTRADKVLKRVLDEGYQVTGIKVKKLEQTSEPTVVVKLFGEYRRVTIEVAIKCGFKIEIL